MAKLQCGGLTLRHRWDFAEAPRGQIKRQVNLHPSFDQGIPRASGCAKIPREVETTLFF